MLKEEARRWLEAASGDLSDAEYNLHGERWRTAAFLAQQAAEKALKAVLLQRQGRFPRIHDLALLALEANVAARYPDVQDGLEQVETAELVATAKEVVAWVRTQLS